MKKIRLLAVLTLLLGLFSAVFPASNLLSMELTHEMTDEERQLMPDYLQELRSRTRATTPPSQARSIAEFERMKGALISYPLGIPVAIVKEISQDEIVYTIVDDASEEASAKSYYQNKGVNTNNCIYVQARNDAHWTRDYGPWFIAENNQISIMDFTYNRPRPNDNKIPKVMANFLNLKYYNMDLVQCGGNYMTDGLGIAVSTDLVYEENKDKSQSSIKNIMKDYNGIDNYHVTKDPLGDYIKHVDCWGKFLAVDKILITRVPKSSNKYKDYEDMVNYFKGQKSSYGTPYTVYRVDSPNGEPYTNSVILNKKVYVPIEGSSADTAALNAYKKAMPGYKVFGYKGEWYTTDAAHCRIKGIADTKMVYIEHIPLRGELSSSSGFNISAQIIPYSGKSLKMSSVGIYYSINGGSFQFKSMTSSGGNTYSGKIASQPNGTSVKYYLHAEDNSGNKNDYPLIGSGDPFLFTVKSDSDPDPDPVKPKASFSSDTRVVAVGSSVHFTDDSSNNPTQWEWNFEGGTPEFSTDNNPVVTYDQEGTYTVTLTVRNQTGTDTVTRVDYITVDEKPEIGCGSIFNQLK